MNLIKGCKQMLVVL